MLNGFSLYTLGKVYCKNEAVAINVEEFRHRLTSTFAGRNMALLSKNESPRQAMARDIRNMRDIYRYEKRIY